MDNRKLTPALDKSLIYLRDSVLKGVWPQGSRVPPYIQLAHAVQVSSRTMLKALKIVQKEGLLHARPRRGIFAGQAPAASNKLDNRKKCKWETIKHLLQNDIMTGVFHNQTYLPSIKELTGFYETGYGVIKKAIDALVREKLVVPYKRTYRIEHFVSTASSRQAICFIGSSKILSGISAEYETTWVQSFVRSLEKECSLKNLALTKYSFASNPPQYDATLESTLGFIFWFSSDIIIEFPSGKEIIEFVRFISQYKKPIAIFNFVGVRDFEIYSTCIKPGIVNCPVFLSDFNRDYQAGVKVGRFLLSKGHKKAGFFAPDHTHLFAQERFRGMVDAFSSAGFENTVTPYFLSEFVPEPTRNKPISMAQENNGILFAQKSEDFTRIITLVKSQMTRSVYHEDRVIKHIEQLKEWLDLRRMFTPLFQKALLTGNPCAWVCSNDALAIYAAKEFLNAEKIKVPSAIGLVGYDDSSSALLNSLTSYHFNLSATARRIINLIIYPKDSARFLAANRENPGVFEVDGVMIDRGSV